jgi:hemolysin III
MGWSCTWCTNELIAALPSRSLQLLVAGGVFYTAGVPFFVRNNNLDHSIWHVFVMMGSICHWVSIYIVVKQDGSFD